MINKTKNFFAEVRAEMAKVTWPTREELFESTWVVLISMFIVAGFVGVVDFCLSHIMKLVMR